MEGYQSVPDIFSSPASKEMFHWGCESLLRKRNNVLDDVLRDILLDGFCVQPESLQVLYLAGLDVIL